MVLFCWKVVHRVTGEVMVVKQLLEFDREAQESFLKEVGAAVSRGSSSEGTVSDVPCYLLLKKYRCFS